MAFKNPFSKPKSKPSKPARGGYPVGKAGNYAQKVDTTTMDAEMIKTLGIKRQKAKP